MNLNCWTEDIDDVLRHRTDGAFRTGGFGRGRQRQYKKGLITYEAMVTGLTSEALGLHNIAPQAPLPDLRALAIRRKFIADNLPLYKKLGLPVPTNSMA